MLKPLLILAVSLLLPLSLRGEDKPVEYEGLIKADSLPDGYKLRRKDVTEGGATVTFLSVDKEGASGRVIIAIIAGENSTNEARRTFVQDATKQTTQEIESQGGKVDSNDGPDIAKADLTKPYVANIVVEDKSGHKRLSHMRTFFTKASYVVDAIGDDNDDAQMKALIKWADSVTEK